MTDKVIVRSNRLRDIQEYIQNNPRFKPEEPKSRKDLEVIEMHITKKYNPDFSSMYSNEYVYTTKGTQWQIPLTPTSSMSTSTPIIK